MKLIRAFSYVVTSAYYVFLMLTDRLTLLFPRRTNEGIKERILLVKLDAIGDFILWLDAAKALRELFPAIKYEVMLLGNRTWSSLAEALPYFDTVWSIDRQKFFKNPVYRFKMLKKIRKAGFDIVVQPTFSREFLYGDAVVRVSGAEKRVGSQGDSSNIKPWQKQISDRRYTQLIPTTKKPLMELERNAEFMRGLGLSEFKADIPELAILNHTPLGINTKDYYVLFPGAGAEFRQWPLSRFSDLARRIYRITGWIGIICGGPGMETLGKILEQNTDIPLQNWAGRTSLQELIAIIARAHILVGNETSAVHIAAAVSTPSVCIVGGGHYGRFIPYCLETETKKPLPVDVVHKMDCFGCNWRCIYSIPKGTSAPCMGKISVNVVWNSVAKILKGRKHL